MENRACNWQVLLALTRGSWPVRSFNIRGLLIGNYKLEEFGLLKCLMSSSGD